MIREQQIVLIRTMFLEHCSKALSATSKPN